MTSLDTMMEEDDAIEEVCLPYSQRPEWRDVSPLHVNDGNCVVAVQYTDEHRDALSYFRAVLQTGEKSERVLKLTADMIGFNQADYTAWQLRWLCIEELNSDLEKENNMTMSIMKANAKNYQLWNHRRKCALRSGASSAQRELDFAAEALAIDEKNYHAWSHRLALVQAFGGPLWNQELLYLEHMLSSDVRNNSAWNQRAFVMKHLLQKDSSTAVGTGSSRNDLEELLTRELGYVAAQVQRAPRNESVWNYLLGLFTLPGCHKREMARWTQVHTICVDALKECPSCPPALSALADYYFVVAESSLDLINAAKEPGKLSSQILVSALAALQAAVENGGFLLEGLMIADPVRIMYWVHRHQALKQILVTASQVD